MKLRVLLAIVFLVSNACNLSNVLFAEESELGGSRYVTDPLATISPSPDGKIAEADPSVTPDPGNQIETLQLLDWGNLGGVHGFVEIQNPGGEPDTLEVTIQGLEPPRSDKDAPIDEWLPYGPVYEGEEVLLSEEVLLVEIEEYLNAKHYLVEVFSNGEKIGEARFRMGTTQAATKEGNNGGGGGGGSTGSETNLPPGPTLTPSTTPSS